MAVAIPRLKPGVIDILSRWDRSIINDYTVEMNDFEQTLQSFRPKLLRTIRLKPEPRYGWRYAAVALAGFFLGVCVTYWTMLPATESAPTIAERTIVLPLDDQTIGTLRRPIDLAKIKPLTVSVRNVEPPNVLTPMSAI